MSHRQATELAAAFASWQGVTERLEETHGRLRDEVGRLTRELEVKNRQLARKNRLADLGEVAAHVAHEIRNPLVAVQLYVSLLARSLPVDEDSSTLVRKIQAALAGLNLTLSDLLHFASDRQPKPEPQGLAQIACEVIDALEPQLVESEVAATIDVDSNLVILADREMLHRALLNLAVNAIEAMPEGGRLRITGTREGTTVCLAVGDTGRGISPVAQSDLFEPFFTTKPTGTGLGLAIVSRVVESHQGEIDGRNQPDGGAVFTLRFPSLAREVAA
jgi:signal transduction histidine kinase